MKNFAILLTYEDEHKEDLTEDEVKEWLSHQLGLKQGYGLKIVKVKEYKAHDSLWATHFLKGANHEQL